MTTQEKIRVLCMRNKTNFKSLEEKLGFSNGYIAGCKHIKYDRLKMIAEYFGVLPQALQEDDYDTFDPYAENFSDSVTPTGYYRREDTRQAAQALLDNKDLKILLDIAADSDPEDIRLVQRILLDLKSRNR